MRVLIAEDSLATRMVLERILVEWGYDVTACIDGDMAWERLSEDDGLRIAILDWMMPGIEGPEICKRLHDRIDGPFVYTLLLTSKKEKEDVLNGLNAGAHDYLSKPFDQQELRCRLEVGVRILNYEKMLADKNKQLESYAADMEELAEKRAKALVHADRMATLGVMSAGVAHEINNPNSFISGNIQTMEKFWEEIEPSLKHSIDAGAGDVKRLNFILNEVPDLLKGLRNGVTRISKIVKGLKTYSRQMPNERTACEPNTLVHEALELCQMTLRDRVNVSLSLQEELPTVEVDGQEIVQVLVNLVVNAVHALERTPNPGVRITSSFSEDTLRIQVHDNGTGIPCDVFERIWDPFFTTKEASKGTGLGLSICRNIMESHGGKLFADNPAEGGARFVLEIPNVSESSAPELKVPLMA